MIRRNKLREQLIKRIVELFRKVKTTSVYEKLCVTSLLNAQEAWEHKEDSQVVFTAKAVKDYGGHGELMIDLSVWRYCSHLEDAGACFLKQLSTDSLYDLIDYYEKRL